MMVDYVNNPLELRRRINAYAFHPDTPAELAEKLQMIPGVEADEISEAAEILYSHSDLLTEQGKTILGELTVYGISQGWNGLNVDGRWEKIRDGVRHDLGEDVAAIAVEDMPEPQTRRRADAIDWRKPPQNPEEQPEMVGGSQASTVAARAEDAGRE